MLRIHRTQLGPRVRPCGTARSHLSPLGLDGSQSLHMGGQTTGANGHRKGRLPPRDQPRRGSCGQGRKLRPDAGGVAIGRRTHEPGGRISTPLESGGLRVQPADRDVVDLCATDLVASPEDHDPRVPIVRIQIGQARADQLCPERSGRCSAGHILQLSVLLPVQQPPSGNITARHRHRRGATRRRGLVHWFGNGGRRRNNRSIGRGGTALPTPAENQERDDARHRDHTGGNRLPGNGTAIGRTRLPLGLRLGRGRLGGSRPRGRRGRPARRRPRSITHWHRPEDGDLLWISPREPNRSKNPFGFLCQFRGDLEGDVRHRIHDVQRTEDRLECRGVHDAHHDVAPIRTFRLDEQGRCIRPQLGPQEGEPIREGAWT